MLRTIDRLLDRGPWIDVAALVVLAVVALGVASLRPTAIVLAAGVVLTSGIRGRGRIAAAAGFLVPIEAIDGISSNVLLAALIGLLVLVSLVYAATVDRPARDLTIVIVLAVVVLADVQRLELLLGGSAGAGLKAMASITVGCLAAGLAATRLEAREPLLRGFIAGVAVSSVVGVLQVADLASPRPYPIPNRGPGLAEFTTVQSFNCAAALFVAAYLIRIAGSRADRGFTFALGTVCAVGLVVNGAQGGLYALAMALAAVGFVARSGLRAGAWPRIGLLVGSVAVLVVAVPMAMGIGVPSIRGLAGDSTKGYNNEAARVDAAEAGIREIIDHPLTGPGSDAFHERNGLAMPHILPLKAGVVAGIAGLALGLAVLAGLVALIIRGPVGRTPAAWMGFAVLVVALARTLTTPDGPFGDTNSMVLFLVAALAASGAEPVVAGPGRSSAGAAGTERGRTGAASATP